MNIDTKLQAGRPGIDGPASARAGRLATAHRLPLVLAALALLVAACSSSSPGASASSLITASYKTLFNMANKSVEPKLAVVQDGASIRKAMIQALSSPLSSTAAGAKIDHATVLSSAGCTSLSLSAPCAEVTYDLLGTSGSPLMSTQTGYAVELDSTWLVAKSTICKLFELFYDAEGQTGHPPGC